MNKQYKLNSFTWIILTISVPLWLLTVLIDTATTSPAMTHQQVGNEAPDTGLVGKPQLNLEFPDGTRGVPTANSEESKAVAQTVPISYSHFTQTDWSSGAGQANWDNPTRFDTAVGIEYGTVGEISLSAEVLTGTLTSSVYDANSPMQWHRLRLSYTVPISSNLIVLVRTGSDLPPDANWTPWQATTGFIPDQLDNHRYLQYQIEIRRPTLSISSPVLNEFQLLYTPPLLDSPHIQRNLQRTNTLKATASMTTAPSITSRYFLGGQLAGYEARVDDLDNDDTSEILTVIGGRVLARHPDGNQQWLSDLLASSIRIEAVADFNCNGRKEILIVQKNQPGTTWLLDSDTGAIVWASKPLPSKELGAYAIPDVTDDQCSDLIIYTAIGNGSRSVTLVSFDTNLAPTEIWTWNGTSYYLPYQVFVDDFDGDGENDILYRSGHALVVHDIYDGSQKAILGIPYGRGGVYIKDVDADPQPEVIILEDQGDIWTNNVGVFDIMSDTITVKWHTTTPQHISQPLDDAINDLDGNSSVEVVSGLYDYDGIGDCANTWCLVIWQADAITPTVEAHIPDLYPMGVIDIDNDGFFEIIAGETDTSDHLPDFSTVHVYDYNAGIMTEKWDLINAGRMAYFSYNNNTQGVNWEYFPKTHMATQNLDVDSALELYFFIDSNQDGVADQLNTYDGINGTQDVTYTIPAETVAEVFSTGSLVTTNSSDTLVHLNTGHLVILDENLTQQGLGLETGGYWTGIPFPKTGSSPFAPLSSERDGNDHLGVLIDTSQGKALNLGMFTNPSVLNWEIPASRQQEIKLIADLDLDGQPEILVADKTQNTVVLLAADGQIELWVAPEFNEQTVYHVGYGDVDHTGNLDIFIQMVNDQNKDDNSIRALNGDTGEQIWQSLPVFPFPWRGLAIFDMNGDGCDDVVTTAVFNDIAIVSGCDGQILWRASWGGSSGIPVWATVANYDSDPYPELCAGWAYETSCWDNDGNDLYEWWHQEAQYSNHPASVDLTGDGINELIYWNSSQALQAISPGESDPIWSIGLCGGAVTTVATGTLCSLSAPIVTDIDGDGQLEALVGGLTDGYLYAINVEDGSLLWVYDFGYPVGNPTVADADGDGEVEILVSVADGYLYVLDKPRPPIQVHGKVTDGHYHPLAGAKVTLLLSDQAIVTKTMTDEDGWYMFAGISPQFDETYQVRVTLNHSSTFQIRYGQNNTDTVYMQTVPFAFSTTNITTTHIVDFDFLEHQTHPDYESNVTDYPERLDDIAGIYRHTAEAINFIEQELGESLPLLHVNIFDNSTSQAYYDKSENAIIIGTASSVYNHGNRPMNREWHETFHHLMAYTIALPLSDICDPNLNHNGYANACTSDSWVEGWAEFWSSALADYLGYPHPELYRVGGPNMSGVISLEDNWLAWDRTCPQSWCYAREEFAVASLLWDLYDGIGANGSSDELITVTRTELWTILGQATPGTMNDMKDVYDAFVTTNIGQNPLFPDPYGCSTLITELDDIFIQHGFFADLNDNRSFSCDEEVGRAADSGRPNRQNAPILPAHFTLDLNLPANFRTTTNISHPITVTVGVFLPNAPQLSYSYDLPLETIYDNRIYIEPLPASNMPMSITLTAYNGGLISSNSFTFNNTQYETWVSGLPINNFRAGSTTITETYPIGEHTFNMVDFMPALSLSTLASFPYLQWNDINEADFYHIYRSTIPYFMPAILYETVNNGHSYVDTNIVAGTDYYYAITAVTENGIESTLSKQVSVFHFEIQPGVD